MKKLLIPFVLGLLCFSCRDQSAPDVSDLRISIKTDRFEQDFFKMDTSNFAASLVQLKAAQPAFADDFTANVLGAGVISDTNRALPAAAIAFERSYRGVYDSLGKVYSDISDIQKDLTKGLQFVKFYFPKYRLPEHLVTFIGPFDAPGVAVTPNAIAIGLQLFAGQHFSFYESQQGQELYPAYISRRFEKQYIVPDCMKAISEDLYADRSGGKSLVEQMIEKGRYWYLLDRLLPETTDSLKTGFTKKQLDWCKKNEGLLWNYFLENNLLFNTDPTQVQLYIGDGPSTQGFGDDSPGNIGQWIGWQVVKAYMQKHPETTLSQLMTKDSRELFQDAKYKPR